MHGGDRALCDMVTRLVASEATPHPYEHHQMEGPSPPAVGASVAKFRADW